MSNDPNVPRAATVYLALLLASGCTTETAHDLVDCDHAKWDRLLVPGPPPAACERSCETIPPGYVGSGSDMPCSASGAGYPSVARNCDRTFVDEFGNRGCCGQNEPANSDILFFECQP